MNHLTQEDLILLYYREPGAPPDASLHLRQCEACHAAARELALTLNLCAEWAAPEPEAAYGRSVWAQLAPRLETPNAGFLSKFRPHTLLWLVPALLTLLMVAFLAGRISKQPEAFIAAGLSGQARQRILAISLADHLDRAETLLTEISNATDSGGVDFSGVRLRAEDMVEEGRLMRQTLAAGGQTSTLSLLDEVERFMLEVANAPERLAPAQVRSLQGRIGSGSLLFKVRIIESNLRTEGQRS